MQPETRIYQKEAPFPGVHFQVHRKIEGVCYIVSYDIALQYTRVYSFRLFSVILYYISHTTFFTQHFIFTYTS